MIAPRSSLYQSGSFTSDLRRRLFGVLHLDPEAGGRPHLPLREASFTMKVGHTTLLRFLDGAQIRSDTLDRVFEYVRQRERKRTEAQP